MPLTPEDVHAKSFATTRLRPGYDEEEVDAFLDKAEAELGLLHAENSKLRTAVEAIERHRVRPEEIPPPRERNNLTPADVRRKKFSTTRVRPGYDQQEVDQFLAEIESTLSLLIQENDTLRAKLAEQL